MFFRGRNPVSCVLKSCIMSFHSGKGDRAEFKSFLSKAKNVVFLTGAGTSAESGIPTFRGAGGLWRKYQATDLATPEAFKANSSLVWEFYSYRREVVLSKKPNNAHTAIAAFEKRLSEQGSRVNVITQNIDGLHQAAGSKNVIELHGNKNCFKMLYLLYVCLYTWVPPPPLPRPTTHSTPSTVDLRVGMSHRSKLIF